LSDYYTSRGAIVCDCYLAAILAGGTPSARPEDVEVNPRNLREVFVAYTDGAPSSDGYPDSRIFIVSKYTTAVGENQSFGGLYKIVEDSADNTGSTFHWQRYLQSGEDATTDGAGFAALDNLSFDSDGNIWGVTDMSTSAHNGFNTTYAGATVQPGLVSGDHKAVPAPGTSGTSSALLAPFGNNWIFYTPMRGRDAGRVVPFGYAPPRAELTGPSFVGSTLFISVQHPGEDSPINADPAAGGTAASTLTRNVEMLSLAGTLYTQTRNVPRGSNWPNTVAAADFGLGTPTPNGPPRPSVACIRRLHLEHREDGDDD
jgi:secreted PhoX family phosphatase